MISITPGFMTSFLIWASDGGAWALAAAEIIRVNTKNKRNIVRSSYSLLQVPSPDLTSMPLNALFDKTDLWKIRQPKSWTAGRRTRAVFLFLSMDFEIIQRKPAVVF